MRVLPIVLICLIASATCASAGIQFTSLDGPRVLVAGEEEGVFLASVSVSCQSVLARAGPGTTVPVTFEATGVEGVILSGPVTVDLEIPLAQCPLGSAAAEAAFNVSLREGMPAETLHGVWFNASLEPSDLDGDPDTAGTSTFVEAAPRPAIAFEAVSTEEIFYDDATFQFMIRNTGNVGVRVSAQADNPGFADVVFDQVLLDPGEQSKGEWAIERHDGWTTGWDQIFLNVTATAAVAGPGPDAASQTVQVRLIEGHPGATPADGSGQRGADSRQGKATLDSNERQAQVDSRDKQARGMAWFIPVLALATVGLLGGTRRRGPV